MKLHDELKIKISNTSYEDVAIRMGYNKRSALKASNRIQKIVQSDTYGLNDGGYDFKYSDFEFVERLCEVLEINFTNYLGEILEISSEISKEKYRSKSWVFVDTKYVRKMEPLFVLAMLENCRRIKIPMNIGTLSLNEQIPHVQSIIRSHHEKNHGTLPLWGDILRYKFVYAETKSIIFDTNGSVMAQSDGIFPSMARLTVKGKDVATVM